MMIVAIRSRGPTSTRSAAVLQLPPRARTAGQTRRQNGVVVLMEQGRCAMLAVSTLQRWSRSAARTLTDPLACLMMSCPLTTVAHHHLPICSPHHRAWAPRHSSTRPRLALLLLGRCTTLTTLLTSRMRQGCSTPPTGSQEGVRHRCDLDRLGIIIADSPSLPLYYFASPNILSLFSTPPLSLLLDSPPSFHIATLLALRCNSPALFLQASTKRSKSLARPQDGQLLKEGSEGSDNAKAQEASPAAPSSCCADRGMEQ